MAAPMTALPASAEKKQEMEDGYESKRGLDTPGLDNAFVPIAEYVVEGTDDTVRKRKNPFFMFYPFGWSWLEETAANDYPLLNWSSFPAFKESLRPRLKAVFTKRFLFIMLLGQLLSVCITATSVFTTELSIGMWQLPTTQSFFVYLILNLVYTPYTIHKYGFKAYFKMLYTDGWRYIILAAVDVEANYTVVKAYQYTDILSASLLDAFATPVCMIVAYFLVKARYHWTQVLGVFIAMVGLAMLLVSDFIVRGGPGTAVNKPKGDGLMIIVYTRGVSNGLEEYLVRNRPLYEVIGQMGFWGTLINGIQASALEHNGWTHEAVWSGKNVGFLAGFVATMLIIYTTAPLLFRYSSSPFYNLSILTSDFWSLCFGIGLFQATTYWLYGIAFPTVIIGLVIYFSSSSPANQADPSLKVTGRGKQILPDSSLAPVSA